jgi:hypothetical protein
MAAAVELEGVKRPGQSMTSAPPTRVRWRGRPLDLAQTRGRQDLRKLYAAGPIAKNELPVALVVNNWCPQLAASRLPWSPPSFRVLV